MSRLEGPSPERLGYSAPDDEGWCCRQCSALVKVDWLLCPYCGEDLAPSAEAAPDELEESSRPHRRRGWLAGLIAGLLVAAGVCVWLGFFRSSSSQQLTGAWMALHRQLTAKSVTAAPAPRTPAADANRVGDVYRDFAAAVGVMSLPAGDESDAHTLIREAIAVANDFAAATWSPPGVTPGRPASSAPLWCESGQPSTLAQSTQCLLSPAQTAEPARAYPGSWNFPPSLRGDLATFDQDVTVLFADVGVPAVPS
jgi:hypothetical protein